MHRYFIVFFAYLFAHTSKLFWVEAATTPSPETSAVVDFDKVGRTADRFAAKVLDTDKDGYKSYTVNLNANRFLCVSSVFFGDKKLMLGTDEWVVNYSHHVKVYWKGDAAPFYAEFSYYDAVWKSWKRYFKLTRDLVWEELFLTAEEKKAEADPASETYYPSLKARLDTLSAAVGDLLDGYVPFAGDAPAPAPGKGEEDSKETDKKKYVLMVVVVVVFVVVASLVVFLVKFCLK